MAGYTVKLEVQISLLREIKAAINQYHGASGTVAEGFIQELEAMNEVTVVVR